MMEGWKNLVTISCVCRFIQGIVIGDSGGICIYVSMCIVEKYNFYSNYRREATGIHYRYSSKMYGVL